MLVFAHRGYHATAPENTLAAFAAAADLGVDGVETDVRISAEGECILYHNRCAPDGRLVSSLRRDELSRAVGYEIASLADALSQDWKLAWNLEVKTRAALEPLCTMLADVALADRILFTSFHHPLVLDLVGRLGGEGGLLVAHRPLLAAPLPEPLPRLRTLVWDFETVDGEAIHAAAALGFRNFVYGALTPDEHTMLLRWGADGTITDRPDLLALSGRQEGRP
jgi:glycerophosphoryl diester phosphodiesterase